MPKMWITIFILLSCVGCVKPQYFRPELDIPDEWRVETNDLSTCANVRWWEQFNDPVLNELITVALANNNDLKVAIERVFEFYAALGIIAAAQLPEVDGNALYNRQKLSLTTLPPNIKQYRLFSIYQGYLSLNYILDFWGQISSQVDAAYYQYMGSIESRRAVVVMVVTSVANAYIQLRQFDLQLQISRETLQSRLKSLDLAKLRFELGETSELEVAQAEAELETAAIEVKQLERQIPQVENQLSILLGQNPQEIMRGLALNKLTTPIEIPAGIPSDLLFQRPEVRLAEDNLISANAEVWVARSLYFPQFTLTGQYGSATSFLHELLKNPSDFWQWGIAAFVPLFNAGKTGYQVMQAEAIREEAYFSFKQVLLRAFREVNDALIAVQKDKELLVEQEKQVKVLRLYLSLATLRYAEGEVDYLNVLDAERTLFNSELNYAQAQADVYTAIISLYAALGGGWVIESDNYSQQYIPE